MTDGFHASTRGDLDHSNERRSSGAELLAGVDIGGSTIVVLIADDELRVAGRRAVPTRSGQPHVAAHQVAEAVQAACLDVGVDPGRLAAVGVGVPGRVDPRDGQVSLALNLGWHDVPLGADLQRALGVPCFVANDVRAAAAGLFERRVLGAIDDLIYISVGTGIAAGIVLRGAVQMGSRGMAGEIGHLIVEPNGRLCVCGLCGCLETVATGPAIAARAQAALDVGMASSLGGRSPLTGTDVYAAANEGDALAVGIVDDAGRHLGRVIYDLALMLDVERICLGGGVANAGRSFIDPIERELDRLRRSSSLAAEVLRPDLVTVLPRGSDAGAWGALLLARKGRTTRSVRSPDRKEVSDRSVPSPLTS